MDELLQAQKENRVWLFLWKKIFLLKSCLLFKLLEMFGAGTAAIVCPVERIVYEGKSYDLPTMDKGLSSIFHIIYFFSSK